MSEISLIMRTPSMGTPLIGKPQIMCPYPKPKEGSSGSRPRAGLVGDKPYLFPGKIQSAPNPQILQLGSGFRVQGSATAPSLAREEVPDATKQRVQGVPRSQGVGYRAQCADRSNSAASAALWLGMHALMGAACTYVLDATKRGCNV